jgi:excisionase family DNA binding protein
MNNPFEVINSRLSNIENLLLEIKHPVLQPPTDTLPADKPMSVNEASEFLDIAVPTVYAKVHRNELPHMKRGGKLYFSRAELMDYLKEGKRKTSSEIKAEAVAFISNHKKSLNNGK